MSFRDCLISAGNQGFLNNKKQLELIDEYDELYEKYLKEGFSKQEASRKAGLDTFNQIQADAAQKLKIKKITLDFQQKFEFRHKQYLEQAGDNYNIGDFLESYTHDITLPQNVIRNISVEEQVEIIQGILDKHMAGILRNFKHFSLP